MFGAGAAFVVIFPLVGLVFVLIGLRGGRRAAHLLANGKLTTGTLKSKVATNTRVNNQTVYKLTFEFQAEEGGTYETVVRTHVVHRLVDEPQERLLYDPFFPARAVLLDNLPGSPRIDPTGQLRASATAPLYVLLPAISLFGHGAYAFLRFFP
jgi:hypothetical protein